MPIARRAQLDDIWGSRDFSKGATAGIVILGLVVIATYIAIIWYLSREVERYRQRSKKKKRTKKLRQWTTWVCMYLGTPVDEAQMCISAWLIAQFNHTTIYPNVGTRSGIRLILWASCWTFVTSTVFVVVLVHPHFRRHRLTEAGPHMVWLMQTWAYWVASVATLNRALPLMDVRTTCAGSVYCGPLRAVFLLAMMEMALLSLHMLFFPSAVGMNWEILEQNNRKRTQPEQPAAPYSAGLSTTRRK
ncbi:hypothetical protein CERSUDRAFT_100342 [Gelatoporia subvermispora B]|uniref:Uncharacterized protein n=1 Tax=Ceriporiopsis subvermispora (strain B) TaxID=914234 RepID=M2QY93_CERS8|nr:hypothetical protein CERSUDRAFT_100342 [Gelatoporia subvermispora B]